MKNIIELDTGTRQLLSHIHGNVGIITLNRPEAKNALSDELTPALRKQISNFNIDDRVNVLIITGAGDAFCAGFIYGIHENWDLKRTLSKAHAAGTAMMKVDASSGKLMNINKL